MSDHLETYIEPDLEARIVAMVLGEASAFEVEELKRLIATRTELKLFRDRMAAIHGMLRETGKGEMESSKEWKLPKEKREALVNTFTGKKNLTEESPKDRKTQRKRVRPIFLVVAAAIVCLLVPVLLFMGASAPMGARSYSVDFAKTELESLSDEGLEKESVTRQTQQIAAASSASRPEVSSTAFSSFALPEIPNSESGFDYRSLESKSPDLNLGVSSDGLVWMGSGDKNGRTDAESDASTGEEFLGRSRRVSSVGASETRRKAAAEHFKMITEAETGRVSESKDQVGQRLKEKAKTSEFESLASVDFGMSNLGFPVTESPAQELGLPLEKSKALFSESAPTDKEWKVEAKSAANTLLPPIIDSLETADPKAVEMTTIDGEKGVHRGSIALSAGSEILVDQASDSTISVRGASSYGGIGVNQEGTVSGNDKELQSHGNAYAQAVNNGGVTRATGGYRSNGRSVLNSMGGSNRVTNTGTIEARGANHREGEIRIDDNKDEYSIRPNAAKKEGYFMTITGDVALDATINATGFGGRIRAGGGYQGDSSQKERDSRQKEEGLATDDSLPQPASFEAPSDSNEAMRWTKGDPSFSAFAGGGTEVKTHIRTSGAGSVNLPGGMEDADRESPKGILQGGTNVDTHRVFDNYVAPVFTDDESAKLNLDVKAGGLAWAGPDSEEGVDMDRSNDPRSNREIAKSDVDGESTPRFGNAPSSRVFGSGGTASPSSAGKPQDFRFINPGSGTLSVPKPVTSALRSGTRAIDSNSIDDLIDGASGKTESQDAPSVFGIAGVYTDPQFGTKSANVETEISKSKAAKQEGLPDQDTYSIASANSGTMRATGKNVTGGRLTLDPFGEVDSKKEENKRILEREPEEKAAKRIAKKLGETAAAEPKLQSRPIVIPIPKETAASTEPFSTFSLHVSDVSFKLAHAALAKGEWPDPARIRIEEFVNAFDYEDPLPSQEERVSSTIEQAIHPTMQQRNLLRIAMRTAESGRSSSTPLNLTFLIDSSGSMERFDRQETLRRAFSLLANQLQENDKVTLISFARQPRLIAEAVSGQKAGELVKQVSHLPGEGGTNLEAALSLALEKGARNRMENSQNRIILLTDGAANLGDANPDRLALIVEKMREAGIAFDAAGIGTEGLNDEILEALTRKGDGRYYLLDRPEDADANFAKQIAGALRPAAMNVKVQVEFNPLRVGRYQLHGFEKHILKKEDFRNDQVDAAEMSAAEAGVALYHFEPLPEGSGDVGSVSVRFRDMANGQMVEKRWPIPYQASMPRLEDASETIRLATAATLTASKLKGEALGSRSEWDDIAKLVGTLSPKTQQRERVKQLSEMIAKARSIK